MSEPTHDPAMTDDERLVALADEFAARLRRGERATVEEYAAKHPELTERIHKAFPAVAMIEGSRTADPVIGGERIGSTIGRYKLLERIGEGGFGVVYMAEQLAPVRRKVAFKVIKPGMDSRQVLARFEAERQALAIMDHPNIAKVFDGGMTDSGRPYFVMELVKGEPITSYCDNHQLPPRQRLELFTQVCQAVQHAHQKGIIHRDLKPSNVLVATHDITPVVKVIDFGVAKALGQELTENTLFTGFAQLLGTPLYMSPEQAGQSSLDIDTRSDIYSLGVLLYELLTGTTPFDRERFKQAAQDEIRRIIREEEPPRPSTRLSESKDSLPSVSAQRRTEPAKLTKLVRGELDWIVMKALEKDRNRRYETAIGFAADVQRYLADEAVLACPPSAGYRLRKFVRRNKAKLVTASVIAAALLVAVGMFGWAVRDRSARQARVAEQVELILNEVDGLQNQQRWPEALAAARRAEAAVTGGDADAATARRVGELLKDLSFIARLEQIRIHVATLIDGKIDRAGADRAYARAFGEYGVDVESLAVETSIERLKARPSLAIPAAAALDDWHNYHYVATRDVASSKRLVRVARGVDPDPLRDRLRSTTGKPASEVQDEVTRVAKAIDIRELHPATIRILASRLQRINRPDSAAQLLRDAQRIYPGDFFINFDLAHLLFEQKDFEGAVRFYTAAVSIRPNVVAAHSNLGLALADQKRPDEAVAVLRKVIEIDSKSDTAYGNLGAILIKQGKSDEAIAAIRKSIEIDPKYAGGHYNLGLALKKQNKLDEAIASYRRAIEIDPKHAKAYTGLGNALRAQGKLDEAIDSHRKAIEIGPKNALQYNNLGYALQGQGKLDEAIATFRKAIEIDSMYARAHDNLGTALQGQGKLDEAIASFRKAIEIDSKHASAHNNLAWLLATCSDTRFRDPEQAVALARKAVERDPTNGSWLNTLGVACYRAGDWKAAIASLEKSVELRKGGDAIDFFFLAMAHWQLGNKAEARRWYDRAVEWTEKNNPKSENLIRFHAEAAELLGVDEKAERAALEAKRAAAEALRELNKRAWSLATNSDRSLRDPKQAVALAEKAVAESPTDPDSWNTLGVARYRVGDFEGAIVALEKFRELRTDTAEWSNPFFLAMAHWQLGKKDEARWWYETAVNWMDAKAPTSQTLTRFRSEAAELLGVDPKSPPTPSTAPATSKPQSSEK